MRTILIVLGLIVLTACSPRVQYIPVENVTHDTLQVVQVKRDSILQRDSVYIERDGSIVRELRWQWLERWHTTHDTIYIARTDSVPVPYAVEKQLSGWQAFKQRFGGVSYCFNILAVAAICLLLTRLLNAK